jgi:hypothetical protein
MRPGDGGRLSQRRAGDADSPAPRCSKFLRQDYIRTARAKGASETSVNYHHALKNAVLPVITIIGIEAAFLIGGLIVTETVFNIPGVARFLVEAIRWRDYPIVQNLVMLIALVVVVTNFTVDMLYARSIHASGTRTDFWKIWRRVGRINSIANCDRAGAHSTHGWRKLTYLVQRHMLGAIGLVIMVLFVMAALLADFIGPLRSALGRFPAAAGASQRAALAGNRLVRPRRLEPDHPRRPHLARVGVGSTLLGSSIGVMVGLASGYLSGWVDLVFQRITDIPAGAAAAGAGAGHDRGAGAVAAERDHRDRDPADPDRRPRDPRQYAGAARAAVRRGRQVDRHERDPHRIPPRSAQHAGAADRAGDGAARLHHSHRSLAVVSRPRHSRALSVMGPACCRNRRRNMSAPRRGW